MTQNIHIYLNIKTDFSFVCNHIFNTFLKNTIKGRHPIDSDASLFIWMKDEGFNKQSGFRNLNL